MSNHTIKDSRKALIAPAHLTVQSIEATAHEWAHIVGQHSGPISLDLSQVESLSTSGIQLICALATTLTQSNRTLQIVNISNPAHAACKDSGCLPLISQWMEQETSHA